jgi:hypothetical protein
MANCQKVKTALSLDISFGKIFAQMLLASLGKGIPKLTTKNATDVHEEETTYATESNSILTTETKSVSDTLVYLR